MTDAPKAYPDVMDIICQESMSLYPGFGRIQSIVRIRDFAVITTDRNVLKAWIDHNGLLAISSECIL